MIHDRHCTLRMDGAGSRGGRQLRQVADYRSTDRGSLQGEARRDEVPNTPKHMSWPFTPEY